MRRSPSLLALLLVLGTGGLTPSPAVAAEAFPVSMPTLRAPAGFSPDGNGVRDAARVRFSLPVADRPTLQVRDGRGAKVRVARFGPLAAGEHTWRWDGRDQRGRTLPDGRYRIRLRPGTPDPRRVHVDVVLDTSFDPSVVPVHRYAVPARRAPVRIFPRSTVVRDELHLDVRGDTAGLDPVIHRARLVIKDSDGTVVRQRSRATVDPHWRVRWTARRGGRPLPPGKYTAVVHGRDSLGNVGRSRPLTVVVSSRPLVWHQETRTFTASEHLSSSCYFTTANGCWDFPDYGSVVPSERFPGGLSFRSAVGAEPVRSRAAETFYLRVPETAGVRGVHSARVTFAGSPTVSGTEDVGRLSLWGGPGTHEVTSTSAATTPWSEGLFLGTGSLATHSLPRFDPGVVWSFATHGDDSFDVDTFTVDLRYLLPASS